MSCTDRALEAVEADVGFVRSRSEDSKKSSGNKFNRDMVNEETYVYLGTVIAAKLEDVALQRLINSHSKPMQANASPVS